MYCWGGERVERALSPDLARQGATLSPSPSDTYQGHSAHSECKLVEALQSITYGRRVLVLYKQTEINMLGK